MREVDIYHKRLRHFLRQLVDTAKLTSAWLCKFDFERRCSIVYAEYAHEEANALEASTDLGEEYPEPDQKFIDWLRQQTPTPDIIHIDEMDRTNPEWQSYVEQGAYSIGYVQVIVNDTTWGFIEFWESRHKREFKDEDIAIIRDVAGQIGDAIAAFLKEQDTQPKDKDNHTSDNQ